MARSYEPVIGLEVHAQISTQSKMFCRCPSDSFGKEPNTNVCPICMGFPGMLPVLNKEALRKGLLAALALHCEIPSFSKFDRKNYFYPDLPKGFQISQYDLPISKNGFLEIFTNGKMKKIRINRLHLEDDAGKLTHVPDGTLCDYNRSGVPLMEIVSEPDLVSLEEASLYAQELHRILRYVGASECDMEKGMMRFDINVSLRLTDSMEPGTKTEVKNLNSFRALERALAHEITRQRDTLEEGGRLQQETRGWDDEKGETFSQRSKEEAHDYRYFPEPDLPPLVTKEKDIEALRKLLPELPLAKRDRFLKTYGLPAKDTELLINDPLLASYFEIVASLSGDAKKACAFTTTVLLGKLNEEKREVSECPVSAEALGKLLKFVNEGVISNNLAKTEIFSAMYETGKDPEVIIREKGLTQVSDTSVLEGITRKVIEENKDVLESIKKGKMNAFGVLVGKVMQETKGQANPKVVNEILHKLLE